MSPVCHVGSAQVLGGKVQPEILQGAVALSTKLVHIYAWVAVAALQLKGGRFSASALKC